MELLVLAKEPVAGRVKTRLCPPCTATEAAEIAEAALAETLATAVVSAADRIVLGLDGAVGPWCPPGVEVVEQGTGDLAARLERLWSHARGPAMQIGMDTPQIGVEDLDLAMAQLTDGDTDAVLGPADDGGWWGLGLRLPSVGVFDGIATSRADTGANQLERLRSLGLTVVMLRTARDVDRWDDAVAAAAAAPGTAFAAAVRRVLADLTPMGTR